jgi:hypothetical protein
MVHMSHKYMPAITPASLDNVWKLDAKWLLTQAFMAYLDGQKEVLVGVKGKSLYFQGIHFPQDSINAQQVWIEEIPPWP